MTKKLAFPGVKAYETQGSGLREGPEQSPHYTNGLCGKASAKTATLETLQEPLSLAHTHTHTHTHTNSQEFCQRFELANVPSKTTDSIH